MEGGGEFAFFLVRSRGNAAFGLQETFRHTKKLWTKVWLNIFKSFTIRSTLIHEHHLSQFPKPCRTGKHSTLSGTLIYYCALMSNDKSQTKTHKISVDTILIKTLLECTKFQYYVWENFTKCHKENTIDTISRNHTNFPAKDKHWVASAHDVMFMNFLQVLLQSELTRRHLPESQHILKRAKTQTENVFLSMCVINNHKMHFIVEVSVSHEISQRFLFDNANIECERKQNKIIDPIDRHKAFDFSPDWNWLVSYFDFISESFVFPWWWMMNVNSLLSCSRDKA